MWGKGGKHAHGRRWRRSILLATAVLLALAGAALAAVPLGLQNPGFEDPLGPGNWSASTFRDGAYQPANCPTPTNRDASYDEVCQISGSDQFTVRDGIYQVPRDVTVTPAEGTHMVRLGGPFTDSSQTQPINHSHLVEQAFQVPNVADPQINLSYNIFTFDYTGFDNFGVQLTDSGGHILFSHGQGSFGQGTSLKTTGWQPLNVDLAGHQGDIVTLKIWAEGTIDTSYGFWVYLDGPALPRAPAPSVTTGAASNVTQTNATLNASVNPNGTAVTNCRFEWGTTTNYGSSVPCNPDPGSGTAAVTVTGALSKLAPGTAYHFRIDAANAGGSSTGADQTFTTPSSSPPAPPGSSPASAVASPPVIATTQYSAAPSVTSTLLSATVNPEGLPTTAHFELGLDPSYGLSAGGVTYTISSPAIQVGSDSTNHSISTTVSGLVPHALYHVRLVATNSAGTSVGPDQTFTTRQDPPPPPPVLGQSVNVKPVSGQVFIRLPNSPARDTAHLVGHLGLAKGQGFIPLTEARQLPTGSQIDARLGTIQLTSATGKAHQTQAGTFSGALFGFAQDARGLNKGLTTLSLLENAFPGAPSTTSCKAGPAPDISSPSAYAAKLSSRVLQTLHGSDHRGHFRTRGRYAAATVRGTVWTMSDRCDGTLTSVQRGTVAVTDLVRHATILVHQGHSYLARAHSAKARRRK